jgi:hypothetical protein
VKRLLIAISLVFAAPAIADDRSMFDKEVAPVLKANCLKCHGGEAKIKGGLRLSSREDVLKGGDSGPAVTLDKPDDSLLLKAISYKDDPQMPPNGKLADKDIEILTRWVKAGAPMTDLASSKPTQAKPVADGKDYWAYQPIKRPEPPAVKNKSWVRNPIDAFVLAKLEASGLSPNRPADPVAFIRRITYDLTGLPPTPDEVDDFVKAFSRDSDVAIEKVIDRLLANPHYGERWGRHWLDVVRYAETNGYERDGAKPFVWRYRDYVIRSFNDDKPYNQFVREQLAGDELTSAGNDGIIATGYYRLGLWDDEPVDPEQALFDGYDDIVATTGQVFLGMTLNCCRCHDHKIDPLRQTDYYRMVAFFRDIRPFSDTRDVHSKFNLTDISPPEKRKLYEAEYEARQTRREELRKEIRPLEDAAIAKMSADEQFKAQTGKREEVVKNVPEFLDASQKERYAALRKELDELRKKPEPKRDLALSVNHCMTRPPATHVLIRGNAHATGAVVTPGFPKVLNVPDPEINETAKEAKTSGRRIALAEWLTSPGNPLPARVMVNRIWHWHFGRGIVASTNDFGKFGDKPTHPELLDWLATEFVRQGWSVKQMHKLILMSNTYQMSSRGNEAALKADPADHLFWRFPMRRLSAEEVRDSVLSASGKLNLQAGGPSVFPPMPKEVLAGQSIPGDGWPTSPPDQANRRSVYVCVKRSLQLPILATHDQADTDSSCPVRYTTTVPTQALGMLNGAFLQECAANLAERLRKDAGDDVTAQVRRAIRLTTGRAPSEDEVNRDAAFIAQLIDKQKLTQDKALQHYCLMVLNANEFVYVD